ncbi:MAG: hypothetical protein ACI4BC_07120 [Muribaculaceae bacterium]
MEVDNVFSKSDFIERENARVCKMRETALKKCGTFVLSCSAIDNKWGIRMEIGDENLLVNPVELVSSIF